jgi:hypothetical protein
MARDGLAPLLRPDGDARRTEVATGLGSKSATGAVANTARWNIDLR